MLGVLSKYLEISEANWLKALTKVLPAKALTENLAAFALGRNI